MGPKFDPNEVLVNTMLWKFVDHLISVQVKFVYLRAVGGEVGATSSLAPKVNSLRACDQADNHNYQTSSGRSSWSFAQEDR